MPWKTLGLVGLGPKAQKHSQKSETCYTYDSACKERRSCYTLEFTFLGRKKKKKLPPGVIYIASQSWKCFIISLTKLATSTTILGQDI